MTPVPGDIGEYDPEIEMLLLVERRAWGTNGENIEASREKIFWRVKSFAKGVRIAHILSPAGGELQEIIPVGSQYAFRFNWDGNATSLHSWDEHTACGWTNKVHHPDGNTGFLVGVGVVPEYRQQLFEHSYSWNKPMRASELLIARTLDQLFRDGVRSVIGNARIPGYHLRSELTVEEYCNLHREDGKLFDSVLRFHERMGAEILKPVFYSMEDSESRNAGCWVIYKQPFEG